MESSSPVPAPPQHAVENEVPPANVGVEIAEPTHDVVDQGEEGNNAARVRGKKPAWSKPSGVAIEVGSVMGALSWPALSESARASVKPLSSEPPPSSPSPQVHQVSLSPKKPNSTSQNSTPRSQIAASRQRSTKRGGDGASSSASSISTNGMPSPVALRSEAEPSTKESTGKNGEHGFRSVGNEHQRSFGGWGRKGSNSNGYQQNSSHVIRRDNDWNRRGINGWDGHIMQSTQHQGVRPYPRPFVSVTAPVYMPTPPPPPLPFHGHPFPTPMVLPDVYPSLYYPPPELSHMIVPPTPVYFPPEMVRPLLLKQIDYYFSPENLCRDVYLRRNMDDQGWVPISLIAGFKRVKELTNSIPYILEVMRFSAVVEIQGDKIRRRNDWNNWLLPSNWLNPAYPGSPSLPSVQSQDSLTFNLQNMVLGAEGGALSAEGGALSSQMPSFEDPSFGVNGHMSGRRFG